MNVSLSASVFALSGAGKEALLDVLPESLVLTDSRCLCLIDAERLEDGVQSNLLSEVTRHARERRMTPIFVLTKADRLPALRAAMARLLGRLKDLGWTAPEVWPVCAEAARLFLLPTQGRELSEAEQGELDRFYDRFGPGDRSLPGFAVTGDLCCTVSGRDVSPLQLRLALENTGVPALIARLEEIAAAPAPTFVPPAAEAAPLEPAPAAQEPAPAEEAPAPAEPAPAAAEPAQAEAPAQEPPQSGALSDWLERVAAADAPSLLAMEEAARSLTLEEPETAELRAAFNRRRWDLQCEQMNDYVSGYEEMDCATLLNLAQSVRDSDFPEAIREKTLEVLRAQFQSRELTELRELTLDSDKRDLDGLEALIDEINRGPYDAQSRAPYLDLVNHRIDELHVQAMETACTGLEQADAGLLAEMRAFVDGRDCADVLKSSFYARLEQRQDELDEAELTALTSDAGQKTPEELDEILRILDEGSWNPRLLPRFRQRIALCREAAVARSLAAEAADLDSMDRDAATALRQRVIERGLPARLTDGLTRRIDERIYRLDILGLAAMENGFDGLDFQELDALRARVARENVCERSRLEYLGRLNQREHALIFETAAPYMSLAQQIAAENKLRIADFNFARPDADFQTALNQFWGGSGLEQPRDIPAFLYNGSTVMGFSGTRFWYKTGRDLAFRMLDEIGEFKVSKQTFSAILVLFDPDGKPDRLNETVKLSRASADKTVAFLNDCLRRWPSRKGSVTTNPIRTDPIDVVSLARPIPETALTEAGAAEILRRRFEAEHLSDGAVIGADAEAWQAKLRKLLQTFGLPEQTRLVWYDTSGILGSIKSAVAVGPAGVYLMNGKQDVRVIPIEDVYRLERSGRRTVLTTVQNQTETADIPAALLPALEEYVKGVQLARYLSENA